MTIVVLGAKGGAPIRKRDGLLDAWMSTRLEAWCGVVVVLYSKSC